MTTQVSSENRNVTGIQTAEPERVYTTTPRVDIREAQDCVVLRIDMPGVDERSASVLVENNELRIEGRTNVTPPEGHTLAREEFPPRFYRRTFDLSDQMNTENIRARISKGVLVLTIPVREAAKPRKVEVVAAA